MVAVYSSSRPTGREDATIYWCQRCGWHKPVSGAMANECGNCGRRGLRFIRYEAGVENAEVEAIIGQPLSPMFGPPIA